MSLPFVASLFYFVWFSGYDFARIVYAGTKVFTLIWPVAAVYGVLRSRFPRVQLQDQRHVRSILPGLVTGAVIVLAMIGLMQTPVGGVVNGSAGAIQTKTEEFGILEHYWLFGMFIALAHSLLEEYYWRWFVFGHLTRVLPVGWAHVAAGSAFAAHHIVVTTQYFPMVWGVVFGLSVGAGGVIWSVMYRRQRTLVGAWMSHLVVDLGMLSIGHRLIFGTYI